VDIQKAFDTVNWQFLEDILVGFGFHERMMNRIMKCVTTTTFSVCVYGKRFGYFKGGRGLRQRDPMSPYLFTLVMEILTLVMNKKVESSNEFKYHFGCKSLQITHLCFVDDLLLFCHGDTKSVGVMKNAIEEFGSYSGLTPNYNKSTIIFGSLSDEEQNRILEIMSFEVEKLPVRYLGVPLISKILGVKDCKCVIDRVKSKVSNWKNKCLSYAGRLQLVASVLESIHVYWASIFITSSYY
jgi:hypothetical protein